MNKLRATKSMGQNLRKLRLCAGLTQEQAAAKLQLAGVDVSRGLLARYETGELNLPVDLLIALTDIYGCTYADYFEGLK